MSNDGVALYLEIEEAKKDYSRSIKTLLTSLLALVVFSAIALPSLAKASFTSSDVINGPVINGKPTIALEAYGIKFNDKILKKDNEAKQWETTPQEKNKITVYVQPDFNVKDLISEKDKDFAEKGRIRYNVFFQNDKNRSKVYSDKDVYIYFSPGSAYTKYTELYKEISLKEQMIKGDKKFYDYYMSNFLFIELYLKEALPQNGAFKWSTAQGIDNSIPGQKILNDMLAAPTNNYLKQMKENTTPFHDGGTNFGVYIPSYYPIQYSDMPEWEAAYRLSDLAYVNKNYFADGLDNKKDITQDDYEKFYSTLANVPNLYKETFENFYNPEKHLGKNSDFYTLSRININDYSMPESVHHGYISKNKLVNEKFDYLALPTFSQNFYRPVNVTSPLNIEYGYMYGQPILTSFDSNTNLKTLNASQPFIFPSESDNSDNYSTTNDLKTFSVYNIEKNALRSQQVALENNSLTEATAASLKDATLTKISSQVVPVNINQKAGDLWTYEINLGKLHSKIEAAKIKYPWEELGITEAKFKTTKFGKMWDYLESKAGREKKGKDAQYRLVIWSICLWDADTTKAFNNNIGGFSDLDAFKADIKATSNVGFDAGLDGWNTEPASFYVYTYFYGSSTGDESSRAYTKAKAIQKILYDTANRKIGDASDSYNRLLSLNLPLTNSTNLSSTNKDTILQYYSLSNITNTSRDTKGSFITADIISCLYVSDTENDGIVVLPETATETSAGGSTTTEQKNNMGFFESLIDALVRGIKFIFDFILGNIVKGLADGILQLGFKVFNKAAFGTATATTALGGSYIQTSMHGVGTAEGTLSSMEEGYVLLQNISLLLMVLLVSWYGVAMAVGDAAGGLIAQTELKDMIPRVVMAIFMIGVSVNGTIFSGSLWLADTILWIVDSLTLGLLNIDMYSNIDKLLNISSVVQTQLRAPDLLASIILLLIAIVLAILFLAAAFLFIARLILIWVLVIMGPIAWLFYVSKSTQSITVTWLKMLTQTITIQFFWIVMLLVFAVVFSMDITGTLGLTVESSTAKTNTTAEATAMNSSNTIEPAGTYTASINEYYKDNPIDTSGYKNYDGSMTDDNIASSDSIINGDSVSQLGNITGVSNKYDERKYVNQKEIVNTIYSSNVDYESTLVPVASEGSFSNSVKEKMDTYKGDDTENSLTGTLKDSFAALMRIIVTSLVAGVFFFTLLKFTGRFASSAMMSGMSTVQGVGAALQQQGSKLNYAKRASNGVINGAPGALRHPFKTAGRAYDKAVDTGRNLSTEVATNRAAAAGVAARVSGAFNGKDINGGLQPSKLEDARHRLSAFDAGKIDGPSRDGQMLDKLMKDMGLEGKDYKQLDGVEKDNLRLKFTERVLDDTKDSIIQGMAIKDTGKTVEQLQAEATKFEQLGKRDEAQRILSQLSGYKNSANGMFEPEAINNYKESVARGLIVQSPQMEAASHAIEIRELAVRDAVENVKNAIPVLPPAAVNQFDIAERNAKFAEKKLKEAELADKRYQYQAQQGTLPAGAVRPNLSEFRQNVVDTRDELQASETILANDYQTIAKRYGLPEIDQVNAKDMANMVTQIHNNTQTERRKQQYTKLALNENELRNAQAREDQLRASKQATQPPVQPRQINPEQAQGPNNK